MASLVLTGDVELQKMAEELLSSGKRGKAIFRKGVRAGAKVVASEVKATFPRKTGKAAGSVKVKSIKRKKGRIGVRVSLFAESPEGFPYPMGLEKGTKNQPKAGRIRKEQHAAKYAKLTWHVKPQHNVEKAFKTAGPMATKEIEKTCLAELEKQSIK